MFEKDYPFEIGKANVMREGTDAAVFACGLMVSETLEAAKLLEAEGIHAAVINVHTIKPIDADCVSRLGPEVRQRGDRGGAQRHRRPGRCRGRCADGQGQLPGSARSASTISSASPARPLEVLREYGLTADQIAARIKETL